MSAKDLTGEPVRDLGFAAWEDNLAPLERMRGPMWDRAIRNEARYASKFIRHPAIQRRSEHYKKILRRVRSKEAHPWVFSAGSGAIDISPNGSLGLIWKWHGDSKARDSADLDATATHVWHIHDTDGSEHYTLTVETRSGHRLWSRQNVGTEVAVVGNRVYYTVCDRVQWPNSIRSADALTGKKERIEHTTSDPHEVFELIKTRDHALFAKKRLANGDTVLYEFYAATKKFVLIDGDSHSQLPGGHGVVIRRTLPVERISFDEDQPFYIDPANQIVLTRKYGHMYILDMASGKELWHEFGATLTPDRWSAWDLPASPSRIFVLSPRHGMKLLIVHEGRVKIHKIGYPHGTHSLKVSEHSARSEDGTIVKYALVSTEKHRPEKLLVNGYGAYNVPTKIGNIWNYWGPLLREGWAIAYAYIRGGGDGPDSWYEAGRREKRINGIRDFEAVVSAARRVLAVPPNKTVIYGRSAGGLLVGQCTVRNPGGGLFGATYTEVPFVDVLRTMTNPEIPLTDNEAYEFGAPHESLVDFGATLTVSPVDAIPQGGVPGVFVVLRTGGVDTQVYPYEGLKFITRMREADRRGGAEPKIYHYKADEGHFYNGDADITARAADLATLDAWADGRLSGFRPVAPPRVRQEKIEGYGIHMARRAATRKNRSTRNRKNRSVSRKNRKMNRKNRSASRKNRKN